MASTDSKSLSGWIKLQRKLLVSTVFADERMLKVFIWCLIRANPKPTDVQVGRQTIHLERGQFVTGRNEAAQELGMSPSAVRRWLTLLSVGQQISLSATNKFTLVTVEKYGLYQDQKVRGGQVSGQQNLMSADSKVDTEEEYIKKIREEEEKKRACARVSPPAETVPDGWGWVFDEPV